MSKQNFIALITKIYGKILAILLSSLGFSAIVSSCADYGTPCTQLKPQYPYTICKEDSRNFVVELQDVKNGSFEDIVISVSPGSNQNIGILRMTPKSNQ